MSVHYLCTLTFNLPTKKAITITNIKPKTMTRVLRDKTGSLARCSLDDCCFVSLHSTCLIVSMYVLYVVVVTMMRLGFGTIVSAYDDSPRRNSGMTWELSSISITLRWMVSCSPLVDVRTESFLSISMVFVLLHDESSIKSTEPGIITGDKKRYSERIMIRSARSTLLKLYHSISTFEIVERNLNTAFKLCHCPCKAANLILVRKRDDFCRLDARFHQDKFNVTFGIVFICRCPPSNDVRDEAKTISSPRVRSKNDKGGTNAVKDVTKLLEIGVITRYFAYPLLFALSYA